jgi:threonine dehydratase
MGVTLADILAARRTIAGVADATPFVPSPFMSDRAGQEFFSSSSACSPLAPSSCAARSTR